MEATSTQTANGSSTARADPAILATLFDPKNRMFILRLEQKMLDFIKAKDLQTENFPPMNSFYRLMVHKVAEHHSLGHTSNPDGSFVTIFKRPECDYRELQKCTINLVDIPNDSEQSSDSSSNNQSAVSRPKARLLKSSSSTENGSQLSSSLLTRSTPPVTAIASNLESKSDLVQGDSKPASKSPSPSSKEALSVNAPQGLGSFEEREAAYQEARARIFKNFESTEDEGTAVNDSTKPHQPEWDPDYARYPSQIVPQQQNDPGYYPVQFQFQAQPFYPSSHYSKQ